MAISTAKRLERNLGGKWKYIHGMCGWQCLTDRRVVIRCSAGVDEFDNPLGPAQYWLYGEDRPQRAEKFMGDCYFNLENLL